MLRFILPLTLAGIPVAAQAASFQDTGAIDRAVATFTGHSIGEEGGARTHVDTKLKLAACPMVAMSWHGVRHDAVTVQCSGPDWRIFVPIVIPAASAPIVAGVAAPAQVAARPVIVIKRGDPVMIQAAEPGFTISREAVAMGDAAAGERFMVRADGANKPFQAIAVEAGRATLPGL